METHLVYTRSAIRNLKIETDYKAYDLDTIATKVYDVDNVGTAIANGSFKKVESRSRSLYFNGGMYFE